MKKKRNIIAVSLAVVLVAALLLGGTIAYLTGESEEVVNTFSTNQNGVTLEETGAEESEDGTYVKDTYNIVPGTSESKDPTVKATYTLDSYVYVEMTDSTVVNSVKLVDYAVESGWKLLSTTDNTDGSTTYVYYMLLETVQYDENDTNWSGYSYTDADTKLTYSYDSESGTYTVTNGEKTTIYTYTVSDDTYTATIPVLEGNKVYYSSDLTNADMENIDNVSLTFQASIIQAVLGDSGTVSPAIAYSVLNGGTYTETTTAMSELSDALADASTTGTTVITVEENSGTANSITVAKDTDVILDLNGNSVNTVYLAEGSTLTLTDSGDGSGVTSKIYANSDDSTLTLDGVTVAAVQSGATTSGGASATVYIEAGTTVTNMVQTSNGGTTVVNGGTIAKVTAQAGSTAGASSTTTINGGTIEQVIVQTNATVSINDGTFTEKVTNQGGTLTINGGTFNGTLYTQGGTTYIYGGTFTGSKSGSGGTLEIYGGTFSSSFSAKLANYVADGYELVTNDGGTYTVVKSDTE
ncbi:MAG: hypothetical protein LUC83_08710 [Clostridiales bacterium]|nr:hypothetical protein [Clostridiales bacterium]